MDSENKRKEKQNKTKRKPEKKLTAAERRRIEREQRKQAGSDDPFAAFDPDGGMSFGETGDLSVLSGLPTLRSENEDMLAAFAESPEPERPRRETEPEEEQGEIKPASHLTRKQRHTRMVASYIGVFFIIVIAAVVLSLTVMFKTTEICVEAENLPYTNEEIISASGLSLKDNIFMAKRKAAEKKLVETFPYVEEADVSFRIPGTQVITIETAVPSYQVQFSGGYAVVSANCRILEINENQRSDIPLLKGIKLDHTQPGEYITFEKASTKQILDEVAGNINENDINNIYGIDISNAANIELNYDNRITILLGLPEDVGYKLRTAKAIINGSLSPNDRGTLDVSLANSDRRSSYFTPIYSDTPQVTDGSSPQPSSENSSRQPEEEASPEITEQGDEYLDDIID